MALLAQPGPAGPTVPVERHRPDAEFAAQCGHRRVAVRHRGLGQPLLGFRQRELPPALAAAGPCGLEPAPAVRSIATTNCPEPAATALKHLTPTRPLAETSISSEHPPRERARQRRRRSRGRQDPRHRPPRQDESGAELVTTWRASGGRRQPHVLPVSLRTTVPGPGPGPPNGTPPARPSVAPWAGSARPAAAPSVQPADGSGHSARQTCSLHTRLGAGRCRPRTEKPVAKAILEHRRRILGSGHGRPRGDSPGRRGAGQQSPSRGRHRAGLEPVDAAPVLTVIIDGRIQLGGQVALLGVHPRAGVRRSAEARTAGSASGGSTCGCHAERRWWTHGLPAVRRLAAGRRPWNSSSKAPGVSSSARRQRCRAARAPRTLRAVAARRRRSRGQERPFGRTPGALDGRRPSNRSCPAQSSKPAGIEGLPRRPVVGPRVPRPERSPTNRQLPTEPLRKPQRRCARLR